MSGDIGPGGKASLVRAINERVVLSSLRRRTEASKSEIAQMVGLTTNAVGLICTTLREQGLIAIAAKRVGMRGQPATPLRLDPTGAYAIGLKLGRRTRQSVLVDFAGTILQSLSRRRERPRDVLAGMAEDIATLTRALPAGAASRLRGIGLALPADGESRQEIDDPDAFGDDWSPFDLRAELAALVDIPVFLENDGTAAAAAELYKGNGRTLDDFALVHIGSSIGGGIVLGGHLHSGRRGNAADFGMMPVAPSRLRGAPRPPDGRPDILRNRASGAALMRHLRAEGLPLHLTSELAQAMTLRPEAVAEWVEDCVDALIRPLFIISSLLDLQAIVFDGLLPRPLLVRIVETLRPAMLACAPESRAPPALLVGDIGREGAALGAAFLPFVAAYGTGALLRSSLRRPDEIAGFATSG